MQSGPTDIHIMYSNCTSNISWHAQLQIVWLGNSMVFITYFIFQGLIKSFSVPLYVWFYTFLSFERFSTYIASWATEQKWTLLFAKEKKYFYYPFDIFPVLMLLHLTELPLSTVIRTYKAGTVLESTREEMSWSRACFADRVCTFETLQQSGRGWVFSTTRTTTSNSNLPQVNQKPSTANKNPPNIVVQHPHKQILLLETQYSWNKDGCKAEWDWKRHVWGMKQNSEGCWYMRGENST